MPIYGDLPSLTQCIKSLIQYLDTENHKVLLVNDVGPDADAIEDAVLKQIKNKPGFKYERNPANLGFIGTCNRAVFELDETDNDILLLNSDAVLTSGALEEAINVLYLSEKHGAVCPRSSNATIASVPFRYHTPREERDTKYAFKVYEKIKPILPRYTVSPVAVGFCILIRRELINNYGLFDPIYGLGYSEENDFCLRINQYGYSSVIANHAFVYHLESKSFTSEKKKMLVAANEAKMIERYPFYQDLVTRYINQYIDPVDWFADVIAGEGKVKILINLFHLPTAFNGTSRNALSFLATAKQEIDTSKYEVVVTAQKDAIVYHNLHSYGFRVVEPSKLDEIFHIGYVPSQVFHLDNLQLLNKYCLKIVVSDLDIIGIRSNALLANNFDFRSIAYDSFRFSDRVISISKATLDDTVDYYGQHLLNGDNFTIIHQGFPGSTFEAEASSNEDGLVPDSILNSEYLLIFGNSYPHKFIKEAVTALKGNTAHPIVVFGRPGKNSEEDNIYYVQSGSISDAYIERLTKGAAAIVFPSVYEGFGLPIAEAAFYGKPIILADTVVSREIASLFKGLEKKFFTNVGDLPKVVESLLNKPATKKAQAGIRTMDDYNRDVITCLVEVIKEPVNDTALRNRWMYFNQISEYTSSRPPGRVNMRIRATTYLRTKSPKAYNKARDVYRKYLKG